MNGITQIYFLALIDDAKGRLVTHFPASFEYFVEHYNAYGIMRFRGLGEETTTNGSNATRGLFLEDASSVSDLNMMNETQVASTLFLGEIDPWLYCRGDIAGILAFFQLVVKALQENPHAEKRNMKRIKNIETGNNMLDMLVQVLKKDSKLFQVLTKILTFNVYFDDHFSPSHIPHKLDGKLLVVWQEIFEGHGWTQCLREQDEHNRMHDNSWCSLSTCGKNCLYVTNDELHISTASTGLQLEREDYKKLLSTGMVIQEYKKFARGPDDKYIQIDATVRERNVHCSVEELRACVAGVNSKEEEA